MSLTSCSARACSAGETPGSPPKSIGFEGSYGRGPGSVVGVGGDVLDVVPCDCATLGEVTIAFGDVAAGPTNGTTTVPVRGVFEPAIERFVVGVLAARFVFVFGLIERRADDDGEVRDELSDGRVDPGPALTRPVPPEHAAAITANAAIPQAATTLRTPERATAGAYANPGPCDSDPNRASRGATFSVTRTTCRCVDPKIAARHIAKA